MLRSIWLWSCRWRGRRWYFGIFCDTVQAYVSWFCTRRGGVLWPFYQRQWWRILLGRKFRSIFISRHIRHLLHGRNIHTWISLVWVCDKFWGIGRSIGEFQSRIFMSILRYHVPFLRQIWCCWCWVLYQVGINQGSWCFLGSLVCIWLVPCIPDGFLLFLDGCCRKIGVGYFASQQNLFCFLVGYIVPVPFIHWFSGLFFMIPLGRRRPFSL